MKYGIEELIHDLSNEDVPKAETLNGLREKMIDTPEAEIGIVIYLTGKIEAYDFTAGEEPVLICTAAINA